MFASLAAITFSNSATRCERLSNSFLSVFRRSLSVAKACSLASSCAKSSLFFFELAAIDAELFSSKAL